ncbi:MAG TPA: hypothetical protein PKO15_11150 [Fibrobacteria bacterium]|nr:hypothetical protein [Fibrobacteria bacterium]HOX51529.1 hypothetical protein [Fibrobacteria bacterium]
MDRDTDAMDPGILNVGLALAMEWGEEWLQPIQFRLATAYPHLSKAELDAYDTACRQAMSQGHREVVHTLSASHGDHTKHHELFRQAILTRHPWIHPRNLNHLFSQGCYYAMK